MLGEPTTCPHGNPIPGSGYAAQEMQVLSSLDVGDQFDVIRIPEELSSNQGLLEFLEEARLVPGVSGTVTALAPDGSATVEIEGATVGVGTFASARILVSTP
ncbi:MAG: hypothetical protein R2706_17505 [Acidimicrobiales bacterium]